MVWQFAKETEIQTQRWDRGLLGPNHEQLPTAWWVGLRCYSPDQRILLAGQAQATSLCSRFVLHNCTAMTGLLRGWGELVSTADASKHSFVVTAMLTALLAL